MQRSEENNWLENHEKAADNLLKDFTEFINPVTRACGFLNPKYKVLYNLINNTQK